MRTDWIYCLAAIYMFWSNGTNEQGESHLYAQTQFMAKDEVEIDRLFIDRSLVTVDSRSNFEVSASSNCMELVTGADPLLSWRISDVTGKILRTGGFIGPEDKLAVTLDLPGGIYLLDLYSHCGRYVRRLVIS